MKNYHKPLRINPALLPLLGLFKPCYSAVENLVGHSDIISVFKWWIWLFGISIPLIWAAFYATNNNKLRLFSITGIAWAGLVAFHSALVFYKSSQYYKFDMNEGSADIRADFHLNSLQFILPAGFILVAYHYYFIVAPLNFLKKNPFTAKIQKARQSGDEPEIRRAITCSALYHSVCRAYYEKIIDLSDLRFRFNDITGIIEEAAAQKEGAIA